MKSVSLFFIDSMQLKLLAYAASFFIVLPFLSFLKGFFKSYIAISASIFENMLPFLSRNVRSIADLLSLGSLMLKVSTKFPFTLSNTFPWSDSLVFADHYIAKDILKCYIRLTLEVSFKISSIPLFILLPLKYRAVDIIDNSLRCPNSNVRSDILLFFGISLGILIIPLISHLLYFLIITNKCLLFFIDPWSRTLKGGTMLCALRSNFDQAYDRLSLIIFGNKDRLKLIWCTIRAYRARLEILRLKHRCSTIRHPPLNLITSESATDKIIEQHAELIVLMKHTSR